MSSITINDIKERFTTVQGISQGLKEDKIRIESELRTLQSDYDGLLAELLQKTGTSTLEEAIAYFNSAQTSLETDMTALWEELSKYLDTYGEEDNG